MKNGCVIDVSIIHPIFFKICCCYVWNVLKYKQYMQRVDEYEKVFYAGRQK